MFRGLDRFSEDLDFSLKVPDSGLDKEQFNAMLAYINEVNIALEMLNEEPFHIENMKEKSLEQDKQNNLSPTSSKL